MMEINTTNCHSAEDFDRQYDLTPVHGAGSIGGNDSIIDVGDDDVSTCSGDDNEPSSSDRPTSRRQRKRGGGGVSRSRRTSSRSRSSKKKTSSSTTPSSFSIDPWEMTSPAMNENKAFFCSMGSGSYSQEDGSVEQSDYDDEDMIDHDDDDTQNDDDEGSDIIINSRVSNRKFIVPADIHPNMEHRDEDIAQLRLLAGRLNADWGGGDIMTPALARRIRDFQFAQEKRRKKYGDERPWGILGLYDHLAAIRVDVEWAEDAAWRRANGEPYLSWADFDANKRKGINRPFFTYFLAFTCTIALIVSIALNGWVVEPLDVNPMIGPSAETLIRMGAKDTYLIVHENEAWRILSSAVLHAGLVHYFINTLALWFVGKAIETSHGIIAAAILFVIPAIGGTILSAIFLPEYITVGASGGIFGLIGACLSDIIMNWKLLFCDFVTENGKRHRHAMVVVFLLLDIGLNCLIGLTPYVDNFTHLGGMTVGFLCGLSTMERLSTNFFGMEENCWSQTKQIVVRFLGLIISVIGIIICAVILLEGDGESTPCPGCAWLSCVPFPPWETQSNKWWYCDDCGRVTAEIFHSPSLHLQLDCPDGTKVAVGLDATSEELDREKLERELPGYCRNLCPEIDAASRYRF